MTSQKTSSNENEKIFLRLSSIGLITTFTTDKYECARIQQDSENEEVSTALF